MTKDEMLERIMGGVYGQEADRNALYAYLSGAVDSEPNRIGSLSIYVYTRVNLDEYMGETAAEGREDAEALYRLVRVMSHMVPARLQGSLGQYAGRYQLYQRAGVPVSFIYEDVARAMLSVANRSCGPEFVRKMIQESVNGLEACYPEVVEDMCKHFKKMRGSMQLGAVMVFVEHTIKKCGLEQSLLPNQSFIKKDENVLLLEQVMFQLLKRVAGKKEILKVAKRYAGGGVIQFFAELPPLELNFQSDCYKKVLFFIGMMASGLSPLIFECMRIFSILVEPKFLQEQFYQERSVWDYIKRFSLPVCVTLRYTVFLMSIPYNSVQGENIKRLEETLESSPAEYLETVKELLVMRQEAGMPLLALMLKKNALPKETADELLWKCGQTIVRQYCSMQTKLAPFSFLEEGLEEFEFLLQERDWQTAVRIEKKVNQFGLQRSFMIGATALLDYSAAARNAVALGMALWQEYPIGALDFFEVYQAFREPSAKGLYDRLFEDWGFSVETLSYIYVLTRRSRHPVVPEDMEEGFVAFLHKHRQEAEDGVMSFHFDGDTLLTYLQVLFGREHSFDYNLLTKVFQRKSKPVAEFAENVLKGKEAETRAQVEELLSSKSKVAADAAMRLTRIWDNEKMEEELSQIHTVEELAAYIDARYTKNNEKNAPYAKEISYACVRAKDSEEYLPETVVKYFVSEYILLKEVYIVKACRRIQEFANIYDLRALVKRIFEEWVSEGASTKYKNLLLPYALTAGESQIGDLKKQIDQWADNSKPALAAFAVQALCMNGSKMALLLTDSLSKKHKSKKVKAAALSAMDSAAEELGISREELDDLIIPDLGFDKTGCRIFSYGERTFRAMLGEKQEISLFDAEGKQIKSLPKAAAKYNDREELAAAAKEELKAVKKQVKLIADTQKPRMLRALYTGRRWSVERWKALFVENRLMQGFAVELVWEEMDAEGRILNTFRYMEDGTFNTAEEEECTLSGEYIALLHPADVERDVVLAWSEQLSDYEIVQPIEQLSAPVFEAAGEEAEGTEIGRYKGKKVYAASFKTITQKFGFLPEFDNYGEVNGARYQEEGTDFSIVLHTSSFYIGDYNAVTTLLDIVFFREDQKAAMTIAAVPKKLLSLALAAADAVTAKALEGQEES